MMRDRRALWLGVLTVFSSAAVAQQIPPSAFVQKVTLNIPSQPIASAIRELGQQTGLTIVIDSQLGRDVKAPALIGSYTTVEALRRILPKALHTEYLDQKTVAVMASAPPTASAAPSAMRMASAAGTAEVPISSTDGPSASEQPEFGAESTSTNQGDDTKKRKGIEEVVVTGTNIRGTEVTTSPILQFDRAAIDRSGYLDTADFIQSIPQVFGGGSQGASQDGNIGAGARAGTNNEHATAVNLRGLGENSTLVLLNGHRMAPSDFGNVVDISIIPLSAIDHIDVLTDGASAIYGADAVAGVVNIVLRNNYNGAETRASYGSVTDGNLREGTVAQLLGRTWDSGAIMGSLQYSREGSLPTSDRSFTADVPQPTNIINPSTETSFVLDGHQAIGEGIEIAGDALATWKRTWSVINRGDGSENNVFSDPHQVNFHLGTSYAFAGDWVADIAQTFSRQQTDLDFYVSPGQVITGRYTGFYTASMSSTDLNINGRLFQLPGGVAKMALGASYRREQARNNETDPSSPSDLTIHRNISAEFAEFSVPLIGPSNGISLVDRFVLSAAVRHDNYSEFGSTANPKVGILWSPISSLDFKANWSRAFRPPSPGELLSNSAGSPVLVGFPFTNPSGPGTIPIFVIGGPNENLGPETATNYNVGFDYSPSVLPGLKLTFDYYNVNFRNRIIMPPFDTNALLHPNVYGSLIGHLPTDTAASAYLANLQSQGYQFIDLNGGTGAEGVRFFYSNQLINAAVVRQNGVDFTGQYTFTVGQNSFRSGVNVAYINEIDTSYAPGATATNLVNTYGNPLRLKLRWDGTWARGPWELTTAINYSNSYANPFVAPVASIASYTTVDLSAAIHLARDDASSFWNGVTVRANAVNLLNQPPPYATGTVLPGVNYDVGNASPLQRFVSIEIIKQW
jgi:iron complex outermembrane recepter protein